jgi:hypothetical protein
MLKHMGNACKNISIFWCDYCLHLTHNVPAPRRRPAAGAAARTFALAASGLFVIGVGRVGLGGENGGRHITGRECVRVSARVHARQNTVMSI